MKNTRKSSETHDERLPDDGFDLEMINTASRRVCQRLGDTKLTKMWHKLGPTGYFRRIRDLAHIECKKIRKELNAKKASTLVTVDVRKNQIRRRHPFPG